MVKPVQVVQVEREVEFARAAPSHWVNGQSAHFQNPWPSFREKVTLSGVFKARFGKTRNFVPVPEEILEARRELVPIRKPNWGTKSPGLKTTWIGHASFFVETTTHTYPQKVPPPNQLTVDDRVDSAAQSQSGDETPTALSSTNIEAINNHIEEGHAVLPKNDSDRQAMGGQQATNAAMQDVPPTTTYIRLGASQPPVERDGHESKTQENAPQEIRPTTPAFTDNGTIVDVEMDKPARGVRMFLDPVFAERMGPMGLVGPKRFSPTPCALSEVPKVDLVLISHNHYDHLDVSVIKALVQDRDRERPVHFFCPLNNKVWLLRWGVRPEHITEIDWWDTVEVHVPDVGSVRLTCTPAQHTTARTGFDANVGLWCSWVIQELVPGSNVLHPDGKNLFFAGDTGYRSVSQKELDDGVDLNTLPSCPVFKEIGEKFGQFDLALLPIGCYLPRPFLSQVHCAPEDSVQIHFDIKSKKSLGMHYGTLRGGISAHYEDVREPPRRWQESAEAAGLKFGEEILTCDIGETVVV